jgi:cell division protein FtsB
MKRKIKKFLRHRKFEERMVFSLGIFILLLFGLYGYFINATVMNVVQMRNVNSQKEQVQTAMSKLEYKYIALSTNLNMDYAKKLGFHSVEDPQFAVRDTSNAFAFAQ